MHIRQMTHKILSSENENKILLFYIYAVYIFAYICCFFIYIEMNYICPIIFAGDTFTPIPEDTKTADSRRPYKNVRNSLRLISLDCSLPVSLPGHQSLC